MQMPPKEFEVVSNAQEVIIRKHQGGVPLPPPDPALPEKRTPWKLPTWPAPAHFLRKSARTCLFLLLGFLLLEGGSRVAYWKLTGHGLSFAEARQEQQQTMNEMRQMDVVGQTPFSDDTLKQFVAHPYLGYIRQPGDKNAVPGQAYLMGTKPLITEPQKDAVVIGIFGASVAEQFSQVGSGALVRALQSDARFRGKRIIIVTGAIGGYKQPQHLMALNYFLSLGQHFDLVITIDGFNEIAGPPTTNLLNKVSLFYPIGWHHIANRMPDTGLLAQAGRLTFTRERRAAWAGRMLTMPLLRYSATAQFLWKGYDNTMASTVSRAQWTLANTAPDLGEATARRGAAPAYDGTKELMADLAQEWAASADLMQSAAAARGIPYLHFLQPNQYVAGTKVFSQEEKRIAFNMEHIYRPLVRDGYPLLQAAGEKLRADGVDFHDLTGIFKKTPATVFHDSCCHMNALGNEVMAASVAKAILARPDSYSSPAAQQR